MLMVTSIWGFKYVQVKPVCGDKTAGRTSKQIPELYHMKNGMLKETMYVA